MFCYHCQEAKKNKVCDTAGICGKKANVSSLQDLLMYALKGLAYYSHHAEAYNLVADQSHRFLAKALFSMVTNVNFSPADFVQLIDETVQRRDSIRSRFLAAYQLKNGTVFDEQIPEQVNWHYQSVDEKEFEETGEKVGVEHEMELLDEDVLNFQECLLYSVKGLGSLAVHNLELNIEDKELYLFMQEALSFSLNRDNTLEAILAMLKRSGQLGLKAMERLEKTNRDHFGHPIPSAVYLDALDNPGILVSGHDLRDIDDLLAQTAGTGIDVYTHGEAISAHSYPKLKKYFNLVGNYGGAWQDQKTQFPKFNGPILVTTNSIQQPKKTYQERLFSTGMVSWPDVPHIADRKPGERKDFSQIIEIAKQTEPPMPLTEGQYTTGYGLDSLRELSRAIISAVESGAIKRIIVLAGTDGRHKERKYYAELAEALPKDALIITAGDAKFRFYQVDFGYIENIPRLLDVGQSNDFCVIIQFLRLLQTELGLEALNDLPVSFNIAWYEQKTILIMLALFALNFQNIRIGPTLPPFFTPKILELLAEKYGLKGIDNVENDVEMMMLGQ